MTTLARFDELHQRHQSGQQGGSARSKSSKPRSYSAECVEGEFCELPLYGVLRSSLIALRQKYATWQMRQHKLSLECLLVKAVRGLELRLEDGRALGT